MSEMTREVKQPPEEEEVIEPVSAQILRRIHRDHSILMRDYDEMMAHLEHPEIKQHLHEHLKAKDKFLSATEKLFKRHHKELPGLEDAYDDDENEENEEELEGEDEGEMGDVGEKDLTEDELNQIENITDEQEEDTEEVPEDSEIKDMDTGDDTGVGDGSELEEEVPPEEAVEGMKLDPRSGVKSIGHYGKKDSEGGSEEPGFVKRNLKRAGTAALIGAAAVGGGAAAYYGAPHVSKIVKDAAKKVDDSAGGVFQRGARAVVGGAGKIIKQAAPLAGNATEAAKRGIQQAGADMGIMKKPPGKIRQAANWVGRKLTGQQTTGEKVEGAVGSVGQALVDAAKKPPVQYDSSGKPIATPVGKKSLCTSCEAEGKTMCSCGKAMGMEDDPLKDDRDEITEARDYLGELSEDGSDYDEEGRLKSYHFHKALGKICRKFGMTEDALGDNSMGMEGGKSLDSYGEKGVIRRALGTAGKLAALGGAGYLLATRPGLRQGIADVASGAARGVRAAAPHLGTAAKVTGHALGKVGDVAKAAYQGATTPQVTVDASGAQTRGASPAAKVGRAAVQAAKKVGHAASAGYTAATTKPPKEQGKAMPDSEEWMEEEAREPEHQEEGQDEQIQDENELTEEELEQHKMIALKFFKSINGASRFFSDISKARDFGDKHRSAARMVFKDLNDIVENDEMDDMENPESQEIQDEEFENEVAGPEQLAEEEVGEVGRKSFNLLDEFSRQEWEIEKLNRRLSGLLN